MSPESIDADFNINHIPTGPGKDMYVSRHQLESGLPLPAFTWDLTVEVGHEHLMLGLLDLPEAQSQELQSRELLAPA